jgi:opacity protein-like surface antigen
MKRLALLCGALLLFAGASLAQDSPKFEAFGGYSYLRANSSGNGYNFNGGSGSLAYNFTPMLGVVADFGGYHWSQTAADATVVTYLFGPKLAFRHGPFTPFAQVLVGGAHASGSLYGVNCGVRVHPEGTPCNANNSDNAFSMSAGGGVDWNATTHIGVRLFQAEYLLTKFSGFGANGGDNENNFRLSTGVVFRW